MSTEQGLVRLVKSLRTSVYSRVSGQVHLTTTEYDFVLSKCCRNTIPLRMIASYILKLWAALCCDILISTTAFKDLLRS